MKKTKIWLSDNIANEIKEYIGNRADLKSRPPLTVQLLKTFPGCENYSDEVAEFKLKCYAVIIPIIADFQQDKKIILIDNQQVENCNQEIEPLKIAA